MVATPEEVKEMERIRRIIDGDISEATAPKPKTLPNGEEAFIVTKGPTRKDVQAMEGILEKLRNTNGSAENAVQTLLENSQSDSSLREALVTEPTPDGAIIGAWKISKVLKEGLTKKEETVYQVQNINTGQKVKADFLVLESAKLIIKLLNQGADLQHPRIREVAEMEIKFRRLRENALTEKLAWHRAKKKNDHFRCDLHEAKFDAAKSKALYFKERIKNLYYKPVV